MEDEFPERESSRLAPQVRRQLEQPNASLTVLVRLSHGAAETEVVAALEEIGVSVRSSGAGGIIAQVNADQAVSLAKMPGVVAIDAPRVFHPKVAPRLKQR